ncbi:hypothetical protein [Yoonia sp.]|jgi:alpha-beta hydrolase superfamily lysophospholipase|uniref:hypothetical protein n=1 Tax=Yoonia sp. TaxID=2212373 RepID=UPI0025FF9BA3|nr:hypothetical protein [Yoonia sp.]
MAGRDMEADIGPDGAVLILAHSLGGHIVSHYIHDLQRFEKRTGTGRYRSPLQNMRKVAGLMTFGCNIPVLLLAYPPEELRQLRDVPISLGAPLAVRWDPLSHGSCWDDADLIAPVAHYIGKMLV